MGGTKNKEGKINLNNKCKRCKRKKEEKIASNERSWKWWSKKGKKKLFKRERNNKIKGSVY